MQLRNLNYIVGETQLPSCQALPVHNTSEPAYPNTRGTGRQDENNVQFLSLGGDEHR